MRKFIYYVLSKFGFIFRSIYSGRLRVLAYHKVPDERAFEEQIKHLIKSYNIISIDDLKRFFKGNYTLPTNALLITFDDGDISVLEKGLPILDKYHLSSCLFVITGLVNTSKSVWIKRVEAGEIKIGQSYQEARKVVNRLKNLPNNKRELEMVKYGPVNCNQLTTSNLRNMEDKGMFIGNHTHTHPMLDKCSKNEIDEELTNSKKVFDSLSLNGFDVFAYPNGNVDEKSQSALKKHAVNLIFLFDHKINKKVINPLCISRIKVDSDTEIHEFQSKVSGVHSFIMKFKG